jgi:cell division septation protein DedD
MLSIRPDPPGTPETTHPTDGNAREIASGAKGREIALDGERVDSGISNVEPVSAEAVTPAPEDYEIVLGRRQVASVLFLATVILAVTSAIAFLAGKSLSPKAAEAASAVTTVPAPISPLPGQPPVIEATIEKSDAAPITPAKPAAAPKPIVPAGSDEPPVFADPRPGATYIQMAAVEKGVAAIFVEGLRRRGFDAIVGPGPSENMYRVLIGPIPDPAAYTRIKEQLDQIGLLTFGRKYEK